MFRAPSGASPLIFRYRGVFVLATSPKSLQFLARGFDPDHLPRRLESQPSGDAIFQKIDVLILKFHDLVAIGAN